MLDVETVFPFLCELGWINPDWIVDGELTIRNLTGRNRNLKVEGPAGLGWVIKQPDKLTTSGARTLGNELKFYEFCRARPAIEPLLKFLPRIVHLDHVRPLLALELVPGAAVLGASEDEPFGVSACGSLGEALGTLHRLFRLPGLGEDPGLSWLSRGLPWAFSTHRPRPGLLAEMSPAALRVYQILQGQEGLDAIFQQLRNQWRHETLIHGDVKSTNVLVCPATGEVTHGVEPLEIRLIDWETVQLGDPAWDLAGALQTFLYHWVVSMPADPELAAEDRIAQARYPLEALQPAVRAFWDGYRSTAGLDPLMVEELLTRAVAFSAVRLIQTSLEYSVEQEKIASRVVLLLQIAANLLASPLLGQVHLYGIPFELIPS